MLKAYWNATRAPRYSVIVALPLFVAYEVMAAAIAGPTGVRNAAEVILDWPFLALFGWRGPLVLWGLLIALGLWLAARDSRAHGPVRSAFFAFMLLEAATLALVSGVLVSALTARLVHPGLLAGAPQLETLSVPARLMLSLGAGLYEELLFRVILVGCLAWAGRRLLGWQPGVAGTVAVVVGATVFSLFHYVGPFGDRFGVYSFLFRALMGVFFSALYVTRGFGITAWTHALYDVFVVLL
jgi:membrane protease YdiL (CAAX protease family)